MSAPKSVVKFTKNGIEYTSSVEKCDYYIYELCRAALKDVSRFVKRTFGENYYQTLKRHTGEGRKAIGAIVYSSKTTKYPRVDMGVMHSNRGKPVRGFYSYFHEVGTSKSPKYAILTKTVEGNVHQIMEIESQYLSAMEDEVKAQALIDEAEFEEGNEDE